MPSHSVLTLSVSGISLGPTQASSFPGNIKEQVNGHIYTDHDGMEQMIYDHFTAVFGTVPPGR